MTEFGLASPSAAVAANREEGSEPIEDKGGVTKLTLRLSPEARKTIDRIASLRGGVTQTEVIRQALGTELFLLEEQKKGNRIIIEDAKHNQRQVYFR